MLVRKILVEEYGDDGWGAKSSWIVNPEWEQIEHAIRRLDRFGHPFVWFYLNEDAQDHDVPEFEIIGGDGAYAMQAFLNGKQRMYRDLSKGNAKIEIWTSDQGTSVPEKMVCYDVDTVLVIARHFYETGALHPSFDWT